MVILILLHGLSWLLYCTYFSSTYVWVSYPYLPSDHLLSPEVLFRILKLLYKRVIPQNNIIPTYFLVSLSLSLSEVVLCRLWLKEMVGIISIE